MAGWRDPLHWTCNIDNTYMDGYDEVSHRPHGKMVLVIGGCVGCVVFGKLDELLMLEEVFQNSRGLFIEAVCGGRFCKRVECAVWEM